MDQKTFADVAPNRKFQLGTIGNALTDVFTSRGNGLAVDATFALYQFPDDMPVVEVVEGEQPKEPA